MEYFAERNGMGVRQRKREIKRRGRGEKGSLTVEASLILPILLSVCFFFLYFFQAMWIHERIHHGLWETAKEISQYGYIYDSGEETGGEEAQPADNSRTSDTEKQTAEEQTDQRSAVTRASGLADSGKVQQCKGEAQRFLGGELTKLRMQPYVSDSFLNASCVKGGAFGVIYETEAFQEEEFIRLTASYKIQIPLFSIIIPDISMVQNVKTRAFVGTTEIGPEETEEEEDQTVYVTRTGSVYHTTLECRHLNLHIESKQFDQVAACRNESGAKYYPCDRCVRSTVPSENQTVYITTDGNRYHTSLQCSGLLRDVRTMKLSEAGAYRPCRHCGGE